MASQFIWYELMTADPDAAAAFYGGVLGWTVRDSGQAALDYRLLSKDGVGVGGLLKIPADAAASGMRPGWFGYVSVEDLEGCLARLAALGGTVHTPVVTVPGVGRLAMVADPERAAFYVMAPIGHGAATSFAPGKPGHGGWHELHGRDEHAALAFYAQLFGWRQVGAMDLRGAGTYLQFSYGSGEMVGGMFPDAGAPRPHWLIYFNVENIDAARTRVVAGGGAVVTEPMPVPTGAWILHARDPQGALCAFVGPRI